MQLGPLAGQPLDRGPIGFVHLGLALGDPIFLGLRLLGAEFQRADGQKCEREKGVLNVHVDKNLGKNRIVQQLWAGLTSWSLLSIFKKSWFGQKRPHRFQ